MQRRGPTAKAGKVIAIELAGCGSPSRSLAPQRLQSLRPPNAAENSRLRGRPGRRVVRQPGRAVQAMARTTPPSTRSAAPVVAEARALHT